MGWWWIRSVQDMDQRQAVVNWVIAWSRVLLEKLIVPQQIKKFPATYGNQRFITTFTSARHLSLSWARSIQSIPSHPTSWRSILILSYHLCRGIPSGLFPSEFPTTTLYTPSLSPIHATWPPISFFSIFITRKIFVKQYWSLKSSLCSFLHSPVTLSLFGPNTSLTTLFANVLSRCFSLSVSDQVSHPYTTTGKITFVVLKCSNCSTVSKASFSFCLYGKGTLISIKGGKFLH